MQLGVSETVLSIVVFLFGTANGANRIDALSCAHISNERELTVDLFSERREEK